MHPLFRDIPGRTSEFRSSKPCKSQSCGCIIDVTSSSSVPRAHGKGCSGLTDAAILTIPSVCVHTNLSEGITLFVCFLPVYHRKLGKLHERRVSARLPSSTITNKGFLEFHWRKLIVNSSENLLKYERRLNECVVSPLWRQPVTPVRRSDCRGFSPGRWGAPGSVVVKTLACDLRSQRLWVQISSRATLCMWHLFVVLAITRYLRFPPSPSILQNKITTRWKHLNQPTRWKHSPAKASKQSAIASVFKINPAPCTLVQTTIILPMYKGV